MSTAERYPPFMKRATTAPSPTNSTTARRIVILSEGQTHPIGAKTASSVVRYRAEEVVALLDSTQAGKTAQQCLGVGGDIPVVGSLTDVADADTLLIGIAPSGGRIPPAWRPILMEAVSRGMHIVSGLHDFLSDDPELARVARQHGAQLTDVRRSDQHDVARRNGIRDHCLRIQTVGNDCCVGKMMVAIEVARALQRLGHDAKFVATGQTGIMIEGDGCAVDCVVSDFVNGASEELVLQNQHHEMLLIEGQGCLAHPKYSAVTLGLLHGALPHGMILCYEAGREVYHGMEHVRLTPLARLRDAYEMMASFTQPSRVIGVAMNSRTLGAEEAEAERRRVGQELGLPVCDVIRHGPETLAEAVLKFQTEVIT